MVKEMKFLRVLLIVFFVILFALQLYFLLIKPDIILDLYDKIGSSLINVDRNTRIFCFRIISLLALIFLVIMLAINLK